MSEKWMPKDGEKFWCFDSSGCVGEDKRKKAEQMHRTVFARITQSPEVLAPYCISTKPGIDGNTLYYYSTVTNHIYLTESQAISATVARLKEVCDDCQ